MKLVHALLAKLLIVRQSYKKHQILNVIYAMIQIASLVNKPILPIVILVGLGSFLSMEFVNGTVVKQCVSLAQHNRKYALNVPIITMYQLIQTVLCARTLHNA